MTGAEVRAAREMLGLTAEEFGLAVGLESKDAARTVRRWMASGTSKRNGKLIIQLLNERAAP